MGLLSSGTSWCIICSPTFYTRGVLFCVCASLANLYARANFYTHNYVNRICPEGRRVSGEGWNKSNLVLNLLEDFFFAGRSWQCCTYWWCCIGRRRTSPGRVVTPSGRRCSGASRCRSHRWRCRSRVPSLKRGDRNVRLGHTFLAWLRTTYSHGEILTMLRRSWQWTVELNELFVYTGFNYYSCAEHRLLWHVAKVYFQHCFHLWC